MENSEIERPEKKTIKAQPKDRGLRTLHDSGGRGDQSQTQS